MLDHAEISFRDAMRRLASTVTIISVGDRGHRHGITATAVTSLSMDPPSLLVCVNRSGSLYAHMAEGSRFCVNLLRSGQASLSDAFSGKLAPHERFQHGRWCEDDQGLPYLADAQASVFCRKQHAIEHGSHAIFIGVVETVLSTGDISPLLYSNGTYSRCVPLNMSLENSV
jgi:flavin reductase